MSAHKPGTATATATADEHIIISIRIGIRTDLDWQMLSLPLVDVARFIVRCPLI